MIALQYLSLLFTCSLTLAFHIKGDIKFQGGSPASIPSGSWLTVKVEEVSLMDVASQSLGKYEAEITDYSPNEPLTYEINNEHQLPGTGSTITVSAIINIGWKASGDAWIRVGDYMTDTQNQLDLNSNASPYVKDVPVVRYT